ncbi:DNA ligase [Kitasatospora sp. NPDC004669]|uniref:ATP-dependent DNA ligase n=1 Tax=Kitasatospora sp. NPDC004669 TaxID=3154555 RepID=UPI0033AE508C
MRPAAVTAVPLTDALGGSGVRYELKLDGFRCVAFARGDRPAFLQSRSGRDLAPEFPPIAAAVARLPEGLVLDAELVAWRSGRFAFEELLHTRQARAAAPDVALGLIAFDLLALPGRDVRRLPLTDRRRLLLAALADVPPPIQPVMATTDRTEALEWMTQLADIGVEGLVCKASGSPYRPRAAGRAWVKYRRDDTVDAAVRALTGPAGRPHALVVRLDDDRVLLTTPRLTPVQAREIAQATAAFLGPPSTDPDHGPVRPLTTPLRAEIILTGRPPTATFVRLRGD